MFYVGPDIARGAERRSAHRMAPAAMTSVAAMDRAKIQSIRDTRRPWLLCKSGLDLNQLFLDRR
jgi:hypothetical protein